MSYFRGEKMLLLALHTANSEDSEEVGVLEEVIVEEIPYDPIIISSTTDEVAVIDDTCILSCTEEIFMESEVSESHNLNIENDFLEDSSKNTDTDNSDSDYNENLSSNSSDKDYDNILEEFEEEVVTKKRKKGLDDEGMNENDAEFERRVQTDDSDNQSKTDKIRSKKKKRKLRKDSGKEYVNTLGHVVNAKKMKPNPCLKEHASTNANRFRKKNVNIFLIFFGV